VTSRLSTRGDRDDVAPPSVVEVIASFEGGPTLWDAIVAPGLEGVVARREREPYRPGARLWVKTKNCAAARFQEELEGATGRRSATSLGA
jgi:ATP-dependent DNA ligase